MNQPSVRTDRVGLLLDQLTDVVELSRLRIDGITDTEFTWEPHPGMWSIRPRGTSTSSDAYGPGTFVLDADQLDEMGFGQYPEGLDPHLPFIAVVRWMNRETIHHLAEVAILRA
jgi:hypothetical protein